MRTKNQDKITQIKAQVEEYYKENLKTPTLDYLAERVGMSRTNLYHYVKYMRSEGMLDYDGKDFSTDIIAKMQPKNINIALVGDIACGAPAFAEENIEEYFSLPERLVGKGKFYLLRAKGKSMIKAGINEGDLVLIRQQDTAEQGQIVVALCDDSEATLKRYYLDKGRVRLHPENDTMQDFYVDKCQIQGVAVKVLKDLV